MVGCYNSCQLLSKWRNSFVREPKPRNRSVKGNTVLSLEIGKCIDYSERKYNRGWATAGSGRNNYFFNEVVNDKVPLAKSIERKGTK